jgi:putative nucleotidyltransferase with HDIG domain
MATQDQRHSLDVYSTLQQGGHTNRHLLTAALLHDVGKSVTRLYHWQRAIIVLLDRLAPRLSAYLSRSDGLPDHVPSPLENRTPGWPRGWRRAFIANAHHAEIGARWAQETGCSPQTVSLIRRHQDKLEKASSSASEYDHLLAELQKADNLN